MIPLNLGGFLFSADYQSGRPRRSCAAVRHAPPTLRAGLLPPLVAWYPPRMGTLYCGDKAVFFGFRTSHFGLRPGPPLNSDASYNAFFKGKHGAAASQIKSFEDTWHWLDKDNAAMRECQALPNGARASLL